MYLNIQCDRCAVAVTRPDTCFGGLAYEAPSVRHWQGSEYSQRLQRGPDGGASAHAAFSQCFGGKLQLCKEPKTIPNRKSAVVRLYTFMQRLAGFSASAWFTSKNFAK